MRVLLFIVVGYISTKPSSSMFGSLRSLQESAAYNGPTIVFSRRAFSSPQTSAGRHRSLVTPAMTLRLRDSMLPDYNNLGMAFFHDITNVTDFLRVISNDDDAILHRERLEMLDEVDEYDVSDKFEHPDEYIPGNPRSQCLRNNNWAWIPKPVCNNLHEVSIDFHAKSVVQEAYTIKYLSHGCYRVSRSRERSVVVPATSSFFCRKIESNIISLSLLHLISTLISSTGHVVVGSSTTRDGGRS
jgi:hypothetical protein